MLKLPPIFKVKPNETIKGVIYVSDLDRVKDYVVDEVINAQLDFYKNTSYSLHLNIFVKANLVCQRCLCDFEKELKLSLEYELVEQNSGENNLNELELSPNNTINLHELVEDEIILAIESYPKHDNDCLINVLEN